MEFKNNKEYNTFLFIIVGLMIIICTIGFLMGYYDNKADFKALVQEYNDCVTKQLNFTYEDNYGVQLYPMGIEKD